MATILAPEHRDMEAWLAGKLEEAWSSEKIASLLTHELLQHVKGKFTSMDTSIKLKLLFSFVSLRKKSFKDVEDDIKEIFELSHSDEDEWVKVMSQMLSSLSQDSIMVENVDGFIQNSSRISALANARGAPQFFPLEYQYLNTELLPPLPSSITSSTTHFSLKKKDPAALSLSSLGLPGQLQTPKKNLLSPSLRVSTNGLSYHPEPTTPKLKPSESLLSPSLSAAKKQPEAPSDDMMIDGNNNNNNNDNWGKVKAGGPNRLSLGNSASSPSLLRNSGTLSRSFENSPLGSSVSERRGFQRKTKMQIIGLEEVKSIGQLDVKKRKLVEGEAESSEEAEKLKKKREKIEQKEFKKAEREEKKKKKQDDLLAKKALMEERRAEKEAKKYQTQAMKVTQQKVLKPNELNPTGATDNSSHLAEGEAEPKQLSEPIVAQQAASFSIPTTAIQPPATPQGMSKKPITFSKPPDGLVPGPMISTSVDLLKKPQTPIMTRPFATPLYPTVLTPTSSILSSIAHTSDITPTVSTPTAAPKDTLLSSLLSQALLPQGGNTTANTTTTPTQTPIATPTTTTTPPTSTPISMPFGQSQIPPAQIQQPFSVSFVRPILPQQPVITPPVVSTPAETATPAQTILTPEQQQQTKALLNNLFEQANQLTPEHKEIILQFLSGNRTNPTPEEGPIKQLQLNFEQKINAENNVPYVEMIIFEINYSNGSWRKFRKKKNLPKPT